MRILLHIGMTKAGSSALQAGLSGARAELMSQGILYPDRGRRQNSHIVLLQGLVPPERIPRGLRQMFRDDMRALERDRRSWLQDLRKTIERERPHTLVLSEEFLYYVRKESALGELRRRLLSLAEAAELVVVVYVRKPSEHYLASVQQLLKASYRIPGPNPVGYRPTIEGYDRHVADHMHVVEYDRAAWVDGDIVQHFLTTFVPSVDLSIQPRKPVNETLSAEAMSVLAEYRSRFFPDQNNRFTSDTSTVIRALTKSDSEIDGDRGPRLHDHIARAVDQTSRDLPWLRDKYGITFDGVDYSDIRRAEGPHDDLPTVDRMCPVDVRRREELIWRVVHYLAHGGKLAEEPLALSDHDSVGTSKRQIAQWIASLRAVLASSRRR